MARESVQMDSVHEGKERQKEDREEERMWMNE